MGICGTEPVSLQTCRQEVHDLPPVQAPLLGTAVLVGGHQAMAHTLAEVTGVLPLSLQEPEKTLCKRQWVWMSS